MGEEDGEAFPEREREREREREAVSALGLAPDTFPH